MKLYIVLWKGTFDKKWSVDGIYTDEKIAQARLTLEQLEHPKWRHAIVEADDPDAVAEQAA